MLSVLKNVSSIRCSSSTQISAIGGVEPYTFSIKANGAGGSIVSDTGVYYAPSAESLSDDPRRRIDTIKVVDAENNEATAKISVLTVEEIIADIISKELNLSSSQVMVQNQKFIVPNDEKIYVAVSIVSGKPYSNNKKYIDQGGKLLSVQTMQLQEMININIMSASDRVLRRRHEVMMAFGSDYGQSKQVDNGFNISRIPLSINNISEIEGGRIPYGFNVSVAIQYGVSKIKEISYYDDFEEPVINLINP